MSPFHGTAFTNRVSNSFHFRIFLKFNKELGVLKRRAATRSDKHSFKEYCADNGLNDNKVLLWMRANNIKDAAAARLLIFQLSKVEIDTYADLLAEAA